MDIINKKNDIHDSDKDKEKLKDESFELDLPDAEDIPGQENVHPPDLKEMADTTIASNDEEGIGIFGDDNVENIRLNREINDEDLAADYSEENFSVSSNDEVEMTGDLTEVQKEALDQTGYDDDQSARLAEVDDTDEDGDPLNERNAANDLDIPGADEDDPGEDIGEEDEENNSYSPADDE